VLRPAHPRGDRATGNDIYIGRQPVFDTKLEVVAYDLLYRDSEVNRARVADDNAATSRVIVDALTEFGLDRLAGGRSVLIKAAAGFLNDDRLLALPADRVIVELLETPRLDDALLGAVRDLAERGYHVCLGDFFYTDAWASLLPFVHLAKVDVAHLNRFQVERQVAALRDHPLMLMAVRVESADTLEWCRELGFDWFAGSFLARPMVTRARRMPASRAVVVRLLSELNHPEASASTLEGLIAGDVSLACRLLRYINSPHFAVSRKVESLRQAIVLLGLTSVRRWATLIALVEMSDKPHALMVTALVRARMAEELGWILGRHRPEPFFTAGLLSVLDVLTDTPMAELMEGMPLADDIRDALLTGAGAIGDVLAAVVAYEHGDWPKVADLGLPTEAVRTAYLDAVSWADEISAALHTA
jgi:EAL and modified HD-GYP domain-containing signal transduction protein